jgi:hypothetical protein
MPSISPNKNCGSPIREGFGKLGSRLNYNLAQLIDVFPEFIDADRSRSFGKIACILNAIVTNNLSSITYSNTPLWIEHRSCTVR